MDVTDRLLWWISDRIAQIHKATFGLDKGGDYAAYRDRSRRIMIPLIVAYWVLVIVTPHGTRTYALVRDVAVFVMTIVVFVNWLLYVETWDELQRRIYVEAAAFSALVTFAIFVTYALLLRDGVLPRFNAFAPAATLIVSFILALPVVRKRYE
jgi:hypothetical protein